MALVLTRWFRAAVAATSFAAAMQLAAPVQGQGPAFSTTMYALGAPYRASHAAAYDPVHHRTVMFGGQVYDGANNTLGAVLGDTWEWDGAWIRRLPVHSPAPRLGHAMTFMPGVGVVLVGGTANGTQCFQDMWRWDGQDWQQMSPPVMPPGLQRAAITYHGGTNPGILLFGGKDSSQTLSNQTWLFDGSTWSLRSSAGPGARWWAAMAYAPPVQRTYMVGGSGPGGVGYEAWMWNGVAWTAAGPWPHHDLFGGNQPIEYPTVVWDSVRGLLCISKDNQRYDGTPSTNDPATLQWQPAGVPWIGFPVEVYDEARQRIVHLACSGWSVLVWEILSSTGAMLNATIPYPPPQARTYFDMTYSAGRAYLFGGWNGTTALNDTWSFDGVAWTNHGASSGVGRIGAALFTFGTPMMFGGGTFTGQYYNDLLYWDGTDWRPALVFALSAAPAARMCHDIVFDTAQQRAVMFGGTNGASFGDTWTLNSSYVGAWWQQIATTGPQPPARNSHRMAYDSSRQRVVMFGGCNAYGQFLNDTWELVGNTWQQVFPAQAPPARWQHMMEYDAQRGVVVLIGGYSNGVFLNDVWEFNGATWTQRAIESSRPPGREGAGSAWDPIRKRVVFCGGYSWATGVLNDTWFYGDQ